MPRRRNFIIAFLILTTIFFFGCQGKPKAVEVGKVFIGGSEGIKIDYSPETRFSVFDGGTDPFDVIIKIENVGEKTILQGKAKISLVGIKPELFGKTERDFTKTVQEELAGKTKTPEGIVRAPPPIFVEFSGLNYLGSIVGAEAAFPLRASICYNYATTAVSNLCVRENILAPTPGGICEIAGPKEGAHSGAPVGILAFEEFARGKNKIGFVFKIQHLGTGIVFNPDSFCEPIKEKDFVIVSVDAGVPGLSCTGLAEKIGTAVKGKVRLIDGNKLISCVIEISSPSDYLLPVKVEVAYDYESSVTKNLTIKHIET